MKATIMIFVASALLVPVQPASGQDPVKLSPHMYTVLLENEHVRVLEFRAKPGEEEPMHSHPAMLVYSFTGGKARVSTPDGKSEERETNAETAVWAEPVTHAYEHLGPGDARVLLIEMKGLTAPKEPAKEGTK